MSKKGSFIFMDPKRATRLALHSRLSFKLTKKHPRDLVLARLAYVHHRSRCRWCGRTINIEGEVRFDIVFNYKRFLSYCSDCFPRRIIRDNLDSMFYSKTEVCRETPIAELLTHEYPIIRAIGKCLMSKKPAPKLGSRSFEFLRNGISLEELKIG